MPSCPGITRQHYTVTLYSLHVYILSFHFISLGLCFTIVDFSGCQIKINKCNRTRLCCPIVPVSIQLGPTCYPVAYP